MKDPKYDIEMNRRFRVGRELAQKLEPLRSQQLVAGMLGISRGYVDKLEAGALYKLIIKLIAMEEELRG